MALILSRSVMFLIPRAASTWARQAIMNAGLHPKECGPKHSMQVPPNAPSFRFTLTREPRAWLRSRWTLGPWTDELAPFWDINKEKFFAAVSDSMVTMYFAKYTQGCNFVGTAENAADDLVKALRMAGEDFDETSLRETPRMNESPADGDPVPEVLWGMKRDDLGKLPVDMIGRLPVDLLPRLPANAYDTLPSPILAKIARRTTEAAMQAAGAATKGIAR